MANDGGTRLRADSRAVSLLLPPQLPEWLASLLLADLGHACLISPSGSQASLHLSALSHAPSQVPCLSPAPLAREV